MHIQHIENHHAATSMLEDRFARDRLAPSFVLEQTDNEGFVAHDLIRDDIYRLSKEVDIIRHLYADDETARLTLHYTVEGVYPGTSGGRHHIRDVYTKDDRLNPLTLTDDDLRLAPQDVPLTHPTFDHAFRHAAWLVLFLRYRHAYLICTRDSTYLMRHEDDITTYFNVDPEGHLILRLTYDRVENIIRSRRVVPQMTLVEMTDEGVCTVLPGND